MEKHDRSTNKITVLVVDDHPLFREGLVQALGLDEDIVIVGHGVDGGEAISLVHQLKPDVVLLDVNLPVFNGYQVVHQLKEANIRVAIVMLTAFHDKHQVLYAMRTGASAYCPKNIHPDVLIKIIHDAADGYYVIRNKRMDKKGVEAWIQENIEDIIGSYVDGPGKPFTPLSPREDEVLHAVAQGKSNKEVASAFGISQQTVKNHISSILRKLHVEDRTQAVVTALRYGWIRLDD